MDLSIVSARAHTAWWPLCLGACVGVWLAASPSHAVLVEVATSSAGDDLTPADPGVFTRATDFFDPMGQPRTLVLAVTAGRNTAPSGDPLEIADPSTPGFSAEGELRVSGNGMHVFRDGLGVEVGGQQNNRITRNDALSLSIEILDGSTDVTSQYQASLSTASARSQSRGGPPVTSVFATAQPGGAAGVAEFDTGFSPWRPGEEPDRANTKGPQPPTENETVSFDTPVPLPTGAPWCSPPTTAPAKRACG